MPLTKKQKTITLLLMVAVIAIAHLTGEHIMNVTFTPTVDFPLN